MIRLLNLLAIAGLVASAVYAYSIKYDTLYQAGQVSKIQTALHKERQAIAVLRAEWQLLTRPDRLQAAVEKHLALEPIGIAHLGRIADLPPAPSAATRSGACSRPPRRPRRRARPSRAPRARSPAP